MMKLGMLETGKMTPDLEANHGAYSDLFVRLLDNRGLDLTFASFAVVDDVFPTSIDECDAWLITGSRHGAYEDLPWIPKLEVFVRQCSDKNIPMVGICFGHQIIAQALGGKVIKSEKGWGLGVNQYTVSNPAPWMNGSLNSQVSVNAVHQDQVVELPQSAQVLASSDFCPNAMIAYGNSIFTVQPHPEFEPDFQADLINSRRGVVFDDALSDQSISSLSQPIDNHMIADWIIGFLTQYA